jgi:hypothetical protein
VEDLERGMTVQDREPSSTGGLAQLHKQMTSAQPNQHNSVVLVKEDANGMDPLSSAVVTPSTPGDGDKQIGGVTSPDSVGAYISDSGSRHQFIPESESRHTVLSSRNLSIHDSTNKEAKESMDLDQTTMIGSALDLDSLEGDSKQNNAAQEDKLGLLKLSAV